MPFGYYLDLDALTVARAAARCGAQCSALFYAEAWIEGKFGEASGITASRWRDQGDGSAGDDMDSLDSVEDSMCVSVEYESTEGRLLRGTSTQTETMDTAKERDKARVRSEKREVERLLLEVFSSLPEPDSIYGVPAPAANLAAQATVYAHEGGWQSTLPTYDTLLQQPSTAGAVLAAANVAVGGGGDVFAPGMELQTGVASSLQVCLL